MKKLLILPITICLCIVATSLILFEEEKFYYGFDEKIIITESKNKIAIQFKGNSGREFIANKVRTVTPYLHFEWRHNAVFLEVQEGKESLL